MQLSDFEADGAIENIPNLSEKELEETIDNLEKSRPTAPADEKAVIDRLLMFLGLVYQDKSAARLLKTSEEMLSKLVGKDIKIVFED